MKKRLGDELMDILPAIIAALIVFGGLIVAVIKNI